MAVSTVFAIGASMSVIFVSDLLLPDFNARFDNYAFAFGIPLGVSPILVYPLVHVNYRMEKVQEKLERLVRTDPLTGLANRRAFFELAEKAFESKSPSPIVLMMVDVDHFKRINDSFGHAAGDVVLKHAAQSIDAAVKRSTAEASCLVARIGGEEFSVLLTGEDARNAAITAEAVCSHVRHSVVRLGEAKVIVTVSIGAAARTDREMIDAVMSAADRGVYQAKHAGRDRWIVASAEARDSPAQVDPVWHLEAPASVAA